MPLKKSPVPAPILQTRPVKPGSVLYTMIQMLAQAVAADLTVSAARCKTTEATAGKSSSLDRKPSIRRRIDG
jgi:hypothetical protein